MILAYWDDQINAFRTQVPDGLSKGFSKKRIDHRHHALDALVIACCTKSHTNYLNSISAENKNYSLRDSLLQKSKEGDYTKYFLMPWDGFTNEVKEKLEKTIISFKQKTRVINKTNNKTWQWVEDKGQLRKKLVAQTKGDNWAIRKPMHTPLPYGKKKFTFSILEISKNLGKRAFIDDNEIKVKVEDVLLQFDGELGKAREFLIKNPLLDSQDNPIKFTVFNIPQTRYRKRQPIVRLANRGQGGIKTTAQAISFINKVSDKLIRKDLLKHLEENSNNIDKAFSVDGIDEFNFKRKIPVYKLPISEASDIKFALGINMSTEVKFGEAEGGTNLFFAIYRDEEKQKRVYDTIPLNEVIEHQKQRALLSKEERKHTPMIPLKAEKGLFLFSISPNDLVYVPTDDDIVQPNLVDFNNLSKEQVGRVYKMVSSSGNQCFFIRNEVAIPIQNKFEFSALNKMEKDIESNMIKECCWKLKVDRLGNLSGKKF